MPDGCTTAKNCYASDPPWNTDKYREETRRRSVEGLQPIPRCGTPPLFTNDFPVQRKSPTRRSRKNTERLGWCSGLDAANSSQPRPMDGRDIPARSVEDSGCTFVTPSFVTENSTRESADRFLEDSCVSRGSGSIRSRCHEKSFHTAKSYSTAEDYHRQSADTRNIYTAPRSYSPAPDISYTVVRHRTVAASDDLSTHRKGRFVSRHISPKSQFVGSIEDHVDQSGVQNESSVVSRISPISQIVDPSSLSRRGGSRKSSNSQCVTSPSKQVFQNQTSVWFNCSREVSQSLPTGQPCLVSNHLPFNRGGSYTSSHQSPRGQCVTSGIDTVTPKSVLTNGAEVVSPNDQIVASSNFSRRRDRSNRSSRRSRKIQRENCSFDQVTPNDLSMTTDVTYMSYHDSPHRSQYMNKSLNPVAPDNLSRTIDGSHMPSQDLPLNQHVASSLNQVAQDNPSSATNGANKPFQVLSKDQSGSSFLNHVVPDNFSVGDVSRVSSQSRSKQNGVTTLVEPPAPISFLTSSYMSPRVQYVTPNNLSVGVDGSHLFSHVSSRNQYVASLVDQVAPKDLSVTRNCFQRSFEMSPKSQCFPYTAEPTVSDNFTEYSFNSPKAQYVPNNISLTRDVPRVSSYHRSPRYRNFASKTRELSFATPQNQYATPNSLKMTRPSLRSSSQVPSADRTSASHVEPFASRMSYSGSAFVEATAHSPDYFQNPLSSTNPCLSSSVEPESFYASASRTPRNSGLETADQDAYEVPGIPRRRRRKSTFAGNPWFICSTKEATLHEDSSINFTQPTTLMQNPCLTSTITHINSSTASSLPQDNLIPSSGFYESFSTPQNRYYETRLSRDSNAVKLVPGSLPMPSQEPDTLSTNINDRVSVATQSNRYGTLASLEMARDPTETTWDSVSHAISLDTSAPPLQRVPRSSSAVPDGGFAVANDTTMITAAATPATSTPRNSREAATISRMFGDESTISKDEPDKNLPGTGRRSETQPKVVYHFHLLGTLYDEM